MLLFKFKTLSIHILLLFEWDTKSEILSKKAKSTLCFLKRQI